MDPSGTKVVAYIKIGKDTYPVHKPLGSKKCHYYVTINGRKIKTPTACPGTGPDDKEGPSYGEGKKQLSELAKKLKAMCGKCTKRIAQ